MRDPMECVPSNLKLMEGNYQGKGWTEPDYAESLAVLEKMSYACFHMPRDVLQKNPQTPSMVVDYRDLVSQPKDTIVKLYDALGLPLTKQYTKILDQRDSNSKPHQTKHSYSAEEFGMDVSTLYRELTSFYDEYQWEVPAGAGD